MSKVINLKVEFHFYKVGILYHRVGIMYNRVKIKHISVRSRPVLKNYTSTNPTNFFVKLVNLKKIRS